MPLEIQKKEKESSQRLVRRFFKRIRESGILRRARESRFRKRPLSKTKKKLAALRREEIKKKLQRMEKMRT